MVVEYKDELFPGMIVTKSSNGEVSVLQRSGTNWKWPRKKDQLFCDKEDIKFKIMPPELEQRGVFKVPELENHWQNF